MDPSRPAVPSRTALPVPTEKSKWGEDTQWSRDRGHRHYITATQTLNEPSTFGCSWIDAAQRLRGDAVVKKMGRIAAFWNGDDMTGGRRCDRARVRGVLVKRGIRSRLHVVRDVVSKNAVLSRRIHHDHVIEALASDWADDAFCVGVLPRWSRRGSNRLDVHSADGGRHVCKDRIAIVEARERTVNRSEWSS